MSGFAENVLHATTPMLGRQERHRSQEDDSQAK
jgi:hypothetical protein